MKLAFPTALLLITPVLLSAQNRHLTPPSPGHSTDQRIAELAKQLAARPSTHTECLLAKAYIQKTRETVDFSYLDRASRIVEDVLVHEGGNYEALRLRSEIGMERHQFQTVAQYSTEILKFAPNDAWSWGMLGDASMELGHYDEAGAAYNKMLALRPDLSSYNRRAWYEFVTGHPAAGIQLMEFAIASVSETPENTAWCLVDLGGMEVKTGKPEVARSRYSRALAVFPGYYPAYAGLGRLDMAEGKDQEAIANFKRAQAVVPLPDYAGALEELYERNGRTLEAGQQRALVDAVDRIAVAAKEKTNRNMALLFADRNRNLSRALELAENEVAVRPDVYSYDALAWVLYRLKRFDEARVAIDKALILHTPEPMFYKHAALIAAAVGTQQPQPK